MRVRASGCVAFAPRGMSWHTCLQSSCACVWACILRCIPVYTLCASRKLLCAPTSMQVHMPLHIVCILVCILQSMFQYIPVCMLQCHAAVPCCSAMPQCLAAVPCRSAMSVFHAAVHTGVHACVRCTCRCTCQHALPPSDMPLWTSSYIVVYSPTHISKPCLALDRAHV